MTNFKYLVLAAVAAPAAIVAAAPAHAQVNGVATADPVAAMYRTKAWTAASAQIDAQYKPQQTQIDAKAAERQKLLAQIDKNGDKQVDDAEMAANPALKAQAEKLETEINQLNMPIIFAKGFAIDRILERYNEAQQAVVTAKKIGIMVSPQSLLYVSEAGDVTAAITAELDRIVPTVSTALIPQRQPSDEALQILQQFLRVDAARAAQAARQAPRPAGAPATTPAAPGARPATTPAAKPTTPPPGR